MILLTIGISFVLFIINLLVGMAIGYSIGFRNDRTLKAQIGRLKQTIRKNNKSAQLKELTVKELAERSDWDFRKRLAEISGTDITSPDAKINDDPDSMERTF